MSRLRTLTEIITLRRPTRWLAAASWRAAILVIIILLSIESALLIATLIAQDMEHYVWTPGPTSQAMTYGTNVPVGPTGAGQWQRRSAADVWHDWHSRPDESSPALLATVGVFGGGAAALGLLALLNLPFVYRSGDVWTSYARALRAGAVVGLAAIMLTLGAIIDALDILGGSGAAGSLGLIAVALPLTGMLIWIAARYARPDTAPVPPQRCEGCGYDLTHRPESGRCTECGTPLEESLDRTRSRPDAGWPRERTPTTFVRTTIELLMRPGSFYRKLRLRTDAGAEDVFARIHLIILWLVALIWLTGLIYGTDYRANGRSVLRAAHDAAAPMTFGLFAVWCSYRLVVAVVGNWWLMRGALPDGAWAARVFCYELAYLWVFCAFWGLFVSSFAIFGLWMRAALPLGVRTPFGIFPEMLVLLAGTTLLTLLWLWRFGVARRAVRWANF